MSLGTWSDAIDYVVTPLLTQEVSQAHDLDSSLAEFILSDAEGLFRNEMGR